MTEFTPSPDNIINDPAELAITYLDRIGSSEAFEVTPSEEKTLVELDLLADAAKMHATYFVKAYKGMLLPGTFEAGSQVTYFDFNDMLFEGKLETYSIVKTGRIIGYHAVRALCLCFDDVIMLPYFDKIDNKHLLHVPALAVASMTRTQD